jgi:hypothetical protein
MSLLLICFDLYAVSQLGVVNNNARVYYEKTLAITNDLVKKYVPKYVE